MFSPIASRSFKVRLLYTILYTLLLLGGATMVIPFLVMLAGSVEPNPGTRTALFPAYLLDRNELWSRYLSAKYQDTSDLLRMAWSEPGASFQQPLPEVGESQVSLWREFVEETRPASGLFFPGFLRANTRMPSYTGREFRRWLLQRHGGELSKVNEALGTSFPKIESIIPPRLNLIGPARPDTKYFREFMTFVALQPLERLIAWDVGGYYRAVFLPNLYGEIQAYNDRYQTRYAAFAEIPFPRTAPATGGADWHFFVSKVLCPNFVELTPAGRAAQEASGVPIREFISTQALPEHVQVVSLDTQFAEWAAARGVVDARIPQREMDRAAFAKEESFWRWHFPVLNYQRVLDEILLHGRAIFNTFVLVVLTVGGALLVNPLAAYALSRFKLRKTYHVLLFCLATIAFPAEVTMIPVFLQMKEFHLLNTFGALVLPGLASGFSIFLLKGFFDSLPKELYEAAELDGASEWTMFWQITMTLSKPILAVIALGAFTSAYGTFFYALILAPDPKMWTLMVYIFQLRSGVDYPVVYASLIITAIPTLLVFIFCQKIILRGIVVPSDK
jgi:multiple sugar transport system permease protein